VSETAAPPPVQNGAAPEGQQTQDPWTQTLEGVDEVYRPHVEQAIGGLREQFTPRLELADRLEPLGDYADDLLALHGMADDDGNALQDFLGFASMASQVDPENPDSEANKAFAEWFYEIGEQMGLIDPEDGDDDGEEFADEDAEGEDGNPEVAELRDLVGQLQQRLEQAESVPRVQAEQQRIDSEVAEAVKKHGLKDDEATKNTILRFARDYVEQPNMIELAVKDLLTLTGGAQRDLLGGEETESVTAGASPGNGSPDMSPEEITTGDPDETRKRAHKVAMSRLRG
jgi:hypothetical protein